MERLTKLVIYLGIGMSVTLFGLLMVTVLPPIIEGAERGWNNLQKNPSEEEIMVMFEQHPAYVAMYERFPNATQEAEFEKHGGATLRVGVINTENNNQLIVNMHYQEYTNSVSANLSCMSKSGIQYDNIDSLFADDIIKTTDCLESKDVIADGR